MAVAISRQAQLAALSHRAVGLVAIATALPAVISFALLGAETLIKRKSFIAAAHRTVSPFHALFITRKQGL